MKINFTNKQFRTLMELVYMGNWMVNAPRTERLEEYEAIESLIFSHAKDFGLEEHVDDEEADQGHFYPTAAFEMNSAMRQYMDEYDDDNFWEELIDRLALEEFLRRHSKEEIETMSDEERRKELYALEAILAKDFEENGLDNVRFLKI